MTFSIICLTYKRTELLEEAVYSVLQQTCPEWELLIINDYDKQTVHFDHPQVRIFNLKDKFKTIAEKRNFGVENANGGYILQLDDDDFLLPHYLEVLKKYVSNHDWLCSQRPILYYDDPTKIRLAPLPQTNTFVYKRLSVGKNFRYETKESDEGITLNSFYGRVITNSHEFSSRRVQLKPDQCGYVWRQDVNDKRKYSLAKLWHQNVSTDDQITLLNETRDKCGDVFLTPKWSKDYVAVIKENIKESPISVKYQNVEMQNIVKDAKLNKNDWETVKPTWANALKFLAAAKSRGVVSTALDAMGVTKTFGERVSDEILHQRRLSCFGDKGMIGECSQLRHVSRGYFCGECGCGKNELARLDADTPDEYTKLHYPELQCPLKRKGFSNESGKLLTVVMTALNEDPEVLNATIKSIRDTSQDVEIIVVDDHSDIPVVVVDSSVRVFRNENRVGCAPSRHFGATNAKNKYVLFTDSHMIFQDGWYQSFIAHAEKEKENVAFCGVCLGLDNETHKDLDHHAGKYYGARLSLYEEKENQVLEGKWIPEKAGEEYEISCMMGATYFINREYFLRLRGLSDLKMWGSDEPCLSLKILLTGGKILLTKDIQIGHIFRNAAPYTTNMSFLIYNKIRMAKTLLPDDLANRLIAKLPKDGNFYAAMEMIEKEKDLIEDYKTYYKSIFITDIQSICETFNIKMI